MNLRGLVVSRFGSIAKFSKELEWSYRKTYSLVTGKQELTIKDMKVLIEKLNLQSAEEIISIFLPGLSTL